MVAQIIDGTAIAQRVRAEVADRVAAFTKRAGRQPGLGIVLVGERPDSQIYVRTKVKTAGEAGLTLKCRRASGDRFSRSGAGYGPATERRSQD